VLPQLYSSVLAVGFKNVSVFIKSLIGYEVWSGNLQQENGGGGLNAVHTQRPKKTCHKSVNMEYRSYVKILSWIILT
jgi:hypothetical protein